MRRVSEEEITKLLTIVRNELQKAITRAKKEGYPLHLTVDELYQGYKNHFLNAMKAPDGVYFDAYAYAEFALYEKMRKQYLI